jgi:hypothetical protein
MKLCAVTAAHILYEPDINTGIAKLADIIFIFIDKKSEDKDDYGLRFFVDPKNILVHPEYIKY